MLSVSGLLIASSSSRFSGVAWGSLIDWDAYQDVTAGGFIVLDFSYVEEPMRAAHASQRLLPGITEVFPMLPGLGDIIGEMENGDDSDEGFDLELPSSVRIDNLQLPSLNDVLSVDLGPLPRHLEDFDLFLSVEADGASSFDDEYLPGVEPIDDIVLAAVGASWQEHVVRAGETLSDIALQYGGITIQDIVRANELRDAHRLSVQQILLIPNSQAYIEDTLEEVRTRKARIAAQREQVKPVQITDYVVNVGDSLWSIASAKNLEVDTLIGSNVFRNSSLLRPGMVLRIPNQDGIFYTFISGDNIDAVATRFRVAVDRVRLANPGVDLNALSVGSEIFLPGARPVTVPAPTPRPRPSGTGQAPTVTGNAQYRWPVMGRISSTFGWRRHPITRRNDFHTGIDIRASRGTPIRAARDGRVTFAGWMGAYGNTVVIDHGGGHSTLYAHASAILVRQGERVTTGQTIARVGSTGRSTGPHLHFEVRVNNRAVDPRPLMRR